MFFFCLIFFDDEEKYDFWLRILRKAQLFLLGCFFNLATIRTETRSAALRSKRIDVSGHVKSEHANEMNIRAEIYV